VSLVRGYLCEGDKIVFLKLIIFTELNLVNKLLYMWLHL